MIESISQKEKFIHGSSVSLDYGARGRWAVLLLGASGSGKSDLALRLIDQGAELVADDQTCLRLNDEGQLIVSAPKLLLGMLEVRGLGLINLPTTQDIPLIAVFNLVAPESIERFPECNTITYLNCAVNLWQIDPFAASATAKLRATVRSLLT